MTMYFLTQDVAGVKRWYSHGSEGTVLVTDAALIAELAAKEDECRENFRREMAGEAARLPK